MNSSILYETNGVLFRCYLDGRVLSLRSTSHTKKPTFGSRYNKFGHLKYTTQIDGKRVSWQMHRLIASAFWTNEENFKEVDHINRNPSDNRAINLRFADRSTNSTNRLVVDKAMQRDGFRKKDDIYRYKRLHEINLMKPNGKKSSVCISEEERVILTPLTQKERFFKLKELRETARLDAQAQAQ